VYARRPTPYHRLQKRVSLSKKVAIEIKQNSTQNHDMGDVVGLIAGLSFLTRSFVTSVNGAGLSANAGPFAGDLLDPGGVVLSPSSSGIVGQYVFKTCLRAGRRMGLERKKSMPESRHSCAGVSFEYREKERRSGLP
jgi:hypothetical protein